MPNRLMHGLTGRSAVAVAVCAMGGLAGPAMAVTYQWNGTVDTNWQTVSNWAVSPGQPASGGATTNADTLKISSGSNSALVYTSDQGTTTFDTLSLTNGQMTISSGTFSTGTATTTVSTLGGGSGSGILNINGGTFSLGTSDAIYINNSGTGSSSVNITDGAANFTWIFQMRSGANGSATVNLDGGTMGVGVFYAKVGTHNTFNFNGGTLKPITVYGWTGIYGYNADTSNVRDGGAIIDTNNRSVEIQTALTHSSIAGDAAKDGGLTKNGKATLTLMAANTYTGDTTINDGAVTLAATGELLFKVQNGDVSNIVKGAGAANFNGIFRLDIAGLTASSGTWHLVDVGALNETFHATTFGLAFVDGPTFTNQGSGIYTSGNWTFDTSSGNLTVLPEPAASSMTMVGLLALLTRRHAH